MSKPESDQPQSFPLREIILALMRADMVTLAATLILSHLPNFFRRLDGLYEVLEHESRLELRDSKGKEARLFKHQKVRFLQDNIIAYQDQAWGDGNIFADYKCSPGIEADRYRDGHKYRILVSLRETKNRGDTEDFYIQRLIKYGFVKSVEDFQVDIDHATRKLVMSVTFPRKRVPKEAKVIMSKAQESISLSADNFQLLPNGHWQILWEKERPRLHEVYILRWEW